MLTIIILSFNRRDALARTLGELEAQSLLASAQVIVVDNASGDGSVAMVREAFASVEVVEMGANAGVAGYNRGAARARGELILTLDDDSWPDSAGLAGAMKLMAEREAVGGVALLPRHPVTEHSEWRHGTRVRGGWPCMGCGNLIRAEAWRKVGGYEEGFFLYRNDADMALKLLGAGYDVWFDPSWVVWHDSPAAARKSDRWLRLATRNWVWMARRHGRGISGALGMCVGAAWALRLAGVNPARWWRVARGVFEGLMRRPPRLPDVCRGDGRWFRELVRVQVLGALRTNNSSSERHSA